MVMKAQRERISSRAVWHRLDELHQVIPQHACIPAEPASVSRDEVIVVRFEECVSIGIATRRSCPCRCASSGLRSRAAWITTSPTYLEAAKKLVEAGAVLLRGDEIRPPHFLSFSNYALP